jgi:uncharacterized protein (DUF1330 family)
MLAYRIAQVAVADPDPDPDRYRRSLAAAIACHGGLVGGWAKRGGEPRRRP